MLIGAIARNFHRLALAKDALERGSREDVFKTVPMPSFKRDAFLATLQRSDPARIARRNQTDCRCRSGNQNFCRRKCSQRPSTSTRDADL